MGAVGFAASVQDTMNAYPQAHGVIRRSRGTTLRLAFHHGGELLEIREHERHRFGALGKDIPRLERGIAHLRERLHNLTPSLVRYHAPGGMLAALTLFDINEDALYWLRTRQETALGYMHAVRAHSIS